jgi:hypothetical protein
MDFLSSVRKQAEVAALTVAEAGRQLSLEATTPRSGSSPSLSTPKKSTSMGTLRSGEPCQTRMAAIEMMTPRSPPDLGVQAPVAAGDTARSFIAARRESLGDRWLLGLGPALASAASQRGDATATPESPSASSVEPFTDDRADGEGDENDGLQWLLTELVVRVP